ncbi:MAG: hypothetical protein J0L64_02875 [Acidobacteria bacterium]|nr:hypothetical protein [Acidobacteriota bacterium]
MRWLLLTLTAIHVVRYWLLPGLDSLWMDETGTWWTIADGWRELWVRTGMHPNSRFYGALLLGWTQVAGHSEWALRLPSLAAMAGAVAVLGVWMERRFGGGFGWAVAAMCVASPDLSFFALDARPYALAVLLLVVATAAWMSLCRQWSVRAGVAWMVSAGLLVHAQPLVATSLLAHGVWLIWMVPWRDWDRRRWWAMAAIVAGAGLVALPEALRLREIAGGTRTMLIPPRPLNWGDLRLLMPPAIAGPAVVALAVLVAVGGWRWGGWGAETKRHLTMGVSLALVMGALLLGYGLSAPANVFLHRYTLAILVGWLFAVPAVIAALTDARGRMRFATVFSAAVLAASVAMQGAWPAHADADWRAAMAAVRQWEGGRAAPVLMQSGLVEAAHPVRLRDARWHGFLVAPSLFYEHAGPTIALPYYVHSRQEPFFDAAVSRVAGQRFAAMVYADVPGTSTYIPRIAARHGPARFLGRFRRLEVYAFDPP